MALPSQDQWAQAGCCPRKRITSRESPLKAIKPSEPRTSASSGRMFSRLGFSTYRRYAASPSPTRKSRAKALTTSSK